MRIDASRIEKVMRKLSRKDPVLFIALRKKIEQIGKLDRAVIEGLKNLRYDFSKYRRVQVGSFVLTFSVQGDTIILERFKHHDKVYKRG